MKTQNFFLAGLPSSGKSSFLAAFWVYANGAPQSSLAVESFPEDAEYLAELQRHWFDYNAVPRTSAGVERSVNLKVKRKSDLARFDLNIPDLSGESFGQIWSQRHWSSNFQSIADDASGALLFVHPTVIEDGATLAQVQALQDELDDEEEEVAGGTTNNGTAEPATWDITNAPTQIKLVDSLQLIAEHASVRKPFRLGVVVSAWDIVRKHDPAASPKAWLRARMPLLTQFLNMNRETYETAVFGVSAQGGDYGDLTPEFQDTQPHQRCLVAGDLITDPTDVTAPINWLVR